MCDMPQMRATLWAHLFEQPAQCFEPDWFDQVVVEAGLLGTGAVFFVAVASQGGEQDMIALRLVAQASRATS